MKSISLSAHSPEAFRAALTDSLSDGFAPTLAFVFISVRQDRKAVCEILREKGIDLLGATSCGEFTDGRQSEGGMAVLLLDLPRDAYSILYEDVGSRTVIEAAVSLSQAATQRFKKPSLIVCSTGMDADGAFFDGEQLVGTLSDNLGADTVFYGGMAGDDMTFSGSYVFNGEDETPCGIVALAFDHDKIRLTGMAITGWQPMGITRTVTRSKGNLLYEIDGLPAAEMYLKYLGKSANVGDAGFKVFEELGYTYPFIVGRGQGETLLKTPLEIDHRENALKMDMEMSEGTSFWFTMPPDFGIVEDVLGEASELRAGLPDADALLIFSCAGRFPVLGPLTTSENEGLAEIWNSAMAGFYTYGEFGRAKNGTQHFHSGACCWVALKEK